MQTRVSTMVQGKHPPRARQPASVGNGVRTTAAATTTANSTTTRNPNSRSTAHQGLSKPDKSFFT